MNRPVRARWPLVVLCGLALLAAGGCGGGGDDAQDAQTETTQPGDAEATEGGGGADEEGVRRVAFVPPGPRDDSTPRGNQWYVFLTDGQCRALLDDAGRADPDEPPVIIYRAAAEACTGDHLAAARNLSRYEALDVPVNPASCGREFVVDFVRNVLNAVREDPDANITFVPARPRPPCPGGGGRQGGGGGGGVGGGAEDDGARSTTTARRSTTTEGDAGS